MKTLNVEIKASCSKLQKIRQILQEQQAYFKGIDQQTDTYFQVNSGRLKLREGTIEKNLIFYLRDNIEGPKKSQVILYRSKDFSSLKDILLQSLGELVIVEKKREIYYVDNVKIHLDEVKNLGSFIEIEAIDTKGDRDQEKLREQCEYFLRMFEIAKSDLRPNSYSDMLLEREIIIRQGTIAEALEFSRRIAEFTDPYPAFEYQKRLSGRRHLILIAEHNGKPVGFKVGYAAGDCFYSWLGGVAADHRRKGIADKLLKYQERWCRQNGFAVIRFKTRNRYNAMLQFALARGYRIISFAEKTDMMESRIILEKKI